MTGRIARFVEIDHTRANVGFEIALKRVATHRNWGKMSGSDEQFIVIFEEQRPVAGVDCWGCSFWLDGVVHLMTFGRNDCHFGMRLSSGRGGAYWGRSFIIFEFVYNRIVCRSFRGL